MSWSKKEWIEAGAIIGDNVVEIDSFIDIAFPWLIEIGDNTVLTGATVLAHDASTHQDLGYSKVGCTRIGKNCFIGHGAIILAGVKIGDNCIIGAGTIVSKDLPSGSVYAGGKLSPKKDFLQKHRDRIASGNFPVIESVENLSPEEKKKLKEKIIETGTGYIV